MCTSYGNRRIGNLGVFHGLRLMYWIRGQAADSCFGKESVHVGLVDVHSGGRTSAIRTVNDNAVTDTHFLTTRLSVGPEANGLFKKPTRTAPGDSTDASILATSKPEKLDPGLLFPHKVLQAVHNKVLRPRRSSEPPSRAIAAQRGAGGTSARRSLPRSKSR